MKNVRCFLSVLFATAPLFAQDGAGAPPPTSRVAAAEQLFRDAWWAESGTNDTDAALRGYLAAVAAEGPAAVRARALLFAGRLQQKQGKADAALTTFRRVLTEFATENAIVNEARGHLRELTAIDLRQNYDEWYERRLFSEEVQLTVLGKIEALAALEGANQAEEPERTERRNRIVRLLAELRAFGKGAVPGLRKASMGGLQQLASTAIDLLFDLGEVPPVAALLANDDWLYDSGKLRLLVTARQRERLPEAPSDRLTARVLAAAWQGPHGLTTFVLEHGGRMNSELTQSWVAAVLPHAESRQRMLEALQGSMTAVGVRRAIEAAFTQWDDGNPWPAAQWLQLGTDPVCAETRTFAVTRVASVLGPDDAPILDSLLQWLVDRDAQPSGHDGTLVNAFATGLRDNPQPELLPWSTTRLLAVLVALPAHPDAQIDAVVTHLTRRDVTRTLLAKTLFAEPLAIATAFRQAGDDDAAADSLARSFVGASGTDADVQMHGRRWNVVLAESLASRWTTLDDPARLAALLLLRGALCHQAEKKPIAKVLAELRGGASAPVQTAIDALLALVGS
jgi:hypothetical protein